MTVSSETLGLTAIVVLAAGYGQRMGQQKLLLPDALGVPIVRRTVQAACTAATQVANAEVCVVCNPEFPTVASAVADLPTTVVWNATAQAGMSTSLSSAISWAKRLNAARVIVLLADQPEVDPGAVVSTCQAQVQSGALIAQVRYHGVPGHPIVFASSLFTELQRSFGDEGGRSVIRVHTDRRIFVDLDDVYLQDVDTPDDYKRFLQRTHH